MWVKRKGNSKGQTKTRMGRKFLHGEIRKEKRWVGREGKREK